MGSLDTRLYLDVNRFAARTAWLHGVARAYAGAVGLLVLGVVLLAAWWRARGGVYGGGAPERVAGVIWAALGGLLALAVAWPVAHLVGRARPYAAIHQAVEVLVARSGGFGLPSLRAALAGGVIAGVFLARDYLAGSLAVVAGLLLAASQVYVGVSYPGDVLAGLLLGVVVGLVLWTPAGAVLRELTRWVAGVTGLRFVVGASAPGSFGTPAPQAEPAARKPSGAVRILESGATLVPHLPDGAARPVARPLAPAHPHVEPAGGPRSPAERAKQ